MEQTYFAEARYMRWLLAALSCSRTVQESGQQSIQIVEIVSKRWQHVVAVDSTPECAKYAGQLHDNKRHRFQRAQHVHPMDAKGSVWASVKNDQRCILRRILRETYGKKLKNIWGWIKLPMDWWGLMGRIDDDRSIYHGDIWGYNINR